jgi:hypothetical protein
MKASARVSLAPSWAESPGPLFQHRPEEDHLTPTLWVPGAGLVPSYITQAEKLVKEYDPDLRLAREAQTGDWVVAKRTGPDGAPFPVLYLGPELPTLDKIKERLYRADTRRRGAEIVQEVVQNNERRLQEAKDRISDENGIAAEALDWAFRKMGKHPNPRIFVPGR